MSRRGLLCRGTAAVLIAGLAAGCVSVPTAPSVAVMPGSGRSFEEFQADDATCRQWAQNQSGSPSQTAGENTTIGAVLGTLIGGALGAAFGAAAGNPAMGAAVGAGVGLAGGTASGYNAGAYAASTVQQRYDVAYQQCMYAKGHQVPMARGTTQRQVTSSRAVPTPPPPPPGSPPPPPAGYRVN